MDKITRKIIDSEPLRFALYLVALMPLLLLRDVTPDNELKYLSIADEALRDGHFWCLFNHGIAYADKPPLYIWLIMLFRRLTGTHVVWLLELFSLIPAFVTLHIFNRWCGDDLEPKWRAAAEAGLLTSAYFLGGAVVLRMDMMMTMFITLAMYTFWRMYRGDGRLALRIAFPLYVFMAIFTKGPVGIMVPLFCIPVYLIAERRLRFMGRIWGWMSWVMLAALCAVWWICVYREGGSEYLDNLLFHQTVDRAVDAFHHKQPFYYYLWSIWYAMAPWCLATIPAIVVALVKKWPRTPLTRFFLIVAATIIVMMSIVSSKLVIYILPAFGFITYAGMMLLQGRGCERLRKTIAIGSAVMLLLAFTAGCLAGRFNDRIGLETACREAMQVAESEGITRFGCHDLRGGENMDVYLGQEVEMLGEEDLDDASGIIVFTKGEKGRKADFKVYKKADNITAN